MLRLLLLIILLNIDHVLALRGLKNDEISAAAGEEVVKNVTEHAIARDRDWKYKHDLTPSADITCQNEEDFEYLGMSCSNIEFSAETLRKDLCQIPEIHLKCAKACGRCGCGDDPMYSILVSAVDLVYQKCAWLRGDESRQNHWCDTHNNGRIVREGCRVSCNACLDYVTMNPSAAPTKSPPPSSTPSRSPTSTPTESLKPSQSPSENPTSTPTISPPNLIMIMTDEHNYRTLGCYRKYLRSISQRNQTNVWGKNWVYTPNIDRLSEEGALFSNFYTVAPLCTPSRASFMSGLYPSFTGADANTAVMNVDVITFAKILKEQENYFTSYMGKWHLSGDAKPGWNDPGRDFGFDRSRFKFNRGHWKYFEASKDSWEVYEHTIDDEGRFEGRLEEHYATDFLFDRGVDDIDVALEKNRPFAMVLSIPDPHGPNKVRPPFRYQFKDSRFEYPSTGKAAVTKDPASPKWNFLDHEDVDPNDAMAYIDDFENGNYWQDYMQQYFAMVECIDLNVGKLLDHLDRQGIADNTIVVFSSDHGDLLGEHGKMNKGRPYETSAGIPLLIRYPNRIKPSKIIQTAYSSVDFTPTILKLMDIEHPGTQFHGVDATPELLSDVMLSNEDKIVFTMDSSARWAAAVTNGYKLVVSKSDVPWLFDLFKDPDELFNYFEGPDNAGIRQTLQTALFTALKNYRIPLANVGAFLWDMPSCRDTNNAVTLSNDKKILCSDLGVSQSMQRCDVYAIVRTECPKKCSQCVCQDSPGKIWISGELKTCGEVQQHHCSNAAVTWFCPSTCASC